jgi:hypothetical protein
MHCLTRLLDLVQRTACKSEVPNPGIIVLDRNHSQRNVSFQIPEIVLARAWTVCRGDVQCALSWSGLIHFELLILMRKVYN